VEAGEGKPAAPDMLIFLIVSIVRTVYSMIIVLSRTTKLTISGKCHKKEIEQPGTPEDGRW
jgi:hypothetical protein